MNTLKITLPDAATDKSLPKLGELAFLWPTTGKPCAVNASGNTTGKIRCENCKITRTYPTPIVGPVDELMYIGSSMAVTPSQVVEGRSYVFFGDKNTITSLEFSTHTSPVDLVHGDLRSCPLTNLNATWLTYRGEKYPIDKLPWDTLSTVAVNSDADHGNPTNLTGDFSDVDLSHVTSIKFANQSIYGNLSTDFVAATNLTYLSLANNQLLTGDVSGLGSITGLTNLVLNTCKNISGTLESLLDAMVAAGRTSGTLAVALIQSSITYNGAIPTRNLTATFTSSGWSVS